MAFLHTAARQPGSETRVNYCAALRLSPLRLLSGSYQSKQESSRESTSGNTGVRRTSTLGFGVGLGVGACEQWSWGSLLSSSSLASIAGSSHATSTAPTASRLLTSTPTPSAAFAEHRARVDCPAARVGAALSAVYRGHARTVARECAGDDPRFEDKVRGLEDCWTNRIYAPRLSNGRNGHTNADTSTNSDASSDSDAASIEADDGLE